MVVRVGKRNQINLLRLFGSFLMIAGFVFLMSSIYNMLWITSILNKQIVYGYDIPINIRISNVEVQGVITNMSDALGILLTPIAEAMFWSGMIILGMIVFRLGEFAPAAPARTTTAKKRKSRKG